MSIEGLVWKYPELDEATQHFLIPSGAVTATFSNGLREYVARAVDRTMGVLVGRASLCDNGQILLIGASPSGRHVAGQLCMFDCPGFVLVALAPPTR